MGATWAELFERGTGRTDLPAIRAALDEVRERNTSADTNESVRGPEGRPDPTVVVADADVLAADVLVNGDARAALDRIREHSWMDLVTSEPLLVEATALIEKFADGDLAEDWRERIGAAVRVVDIPAGDHPALATAYAGGAAHVLTTDEALTGTAAGLQIKRRVETSVKTPRAFNRLFEPGALYSLATDESEEPYPGPDVDPRG